VSGPPVKWRPALEREATIPELVGAGKRRGEQEHDADLTLAIEREVARETAGAAVVPERAVRTDQKEQSDAPPAAGLCARCPSELERRRERRLHGSERDGEEAAHVGRARAEPAGGREDIARPRRLGDAVRVEALRSPRARGGRNRDVRIA